jgi:hypothetical protein
MSSILTPDQMSSILRVNRHARTQERLTAIREALVGLVTTCAQESRVAEKLEDAVRSPYTDYVSVDIVTFKPGARMGLTHNDTGVSIAMLLLAGSRGKTMLALNRGLGRHFRVVSRIELDRSRTLAMEFWPDGHEVQPPGAPARPARPVMNPEEEEVELPMVFRSLSFESE